MASLKPRDSRGIVELKKLTKEIFLYNIIESRKCQAESVINFPFNKSRCEIISKQDEIPENCKNIVYWMSRDCRVQDNWAFLFAQRLAIKYNVPLHICFFCKDSENLYPTKRQVCFLLTGLKKVKQECESLNINFYLVNDSPEYLPKLVLNNDVGGVVCDFSPLKQHKKWIENILKHLPDTVAFIRVDAHNIIPLAKASNKQELMAKTIRPKINKQLAEYLTGFPNVCYHPYSKNLTGVDHFKNLNEAYSAFRYLHDVNEVDCIEPGPESGLQVLYTFITEHLKNYGITSNDPSKGCTSNLSPWLHFGQISAQRVALEVQSIEALYKDQTDKFLEELIVRRELAENYCYYNSNYDNINGAAGWAIQTLNTHRKDKRKWIYNKQQFEKALTHDNIWNAAQVQLIKEGKMHGYMRMYWCKKILEWTESPEKAIEIALWLNDMYSLDGSDPNGFVGVMWSLCCVHDQGWKEREIFGKIRYMVDYSLRRKFEMDAYCQKYGYKLEKIVKNPTRTKKH